MRALDDNSDQEVLWTSIGVSKSLFAESSGAGNIRYVHIWCPTKNMCLELSKSPLETYWSDLLA